MILDWLGLILRWTHVAAAVVWVGASLYLFARGERRFEPELMWPAYVTWIAGFALLCLTFYPNAETYLIVIGITSLIVGLAIYEGLCRSPLGDGALLVFFALVAWGLTQLFDGRSAFVHYGALLGTIMVGNVAHVAVPVARRRAQALREGREPDAADARRETQRAGHNAALALPVVFAMIANHHPAAYVGRWSWLVLVAVTLAGVAARGRLVPR